MTEIELLTARIDALTNNQRDLCTSVLAVMSLLINKGVFTHAEFLKMRIMSVGAVDQHVAAELDRLERAMKGDDAQT